MTRFSQSSVTAVLGPTNTGKTHLAIERMCAHSSGLIGFPLRLLAREVYDRVVKIKGPGEVALLTGEQRIVPPGARWFLATAESMPIDDGRDFSFVALDEAQLAAHPERGHVFTDRLLRARGRDETMILGSQSLAPMVRTLVPEAEIITRPRFSTLSYAGAKKLSRLPPRTAIIAFSAEQVYAVAEMLRRFRGGAAVVMGALSPATRNAQVSMYQAGEVDYLVATDAIGMGLNMDVDHVAFASLSKYDGRRRRRLSLAEMAQIAGRAGRHQRDGTFGTVAGHGDACAFTDEEIERIEAHEFPPIGSVFWREAQPRYDSIATLIDDLEAAPRREGLRAAPEAIDLAVLKRLADQDDVAARACGADAVRRLWAACSLPDFQKKGADHHATFIAQLWRHLGEGRGTLPMELVARRIADLDNVQGDVETLGGRIAAIRTWSYIAHRGDWLAEPAIMAERAQQVEERLSDALHKGLAQRFVDRRTAVLMKRLGSDAAMLPVKLVDDDVVEVDGEPIGRLVGLRFVVDAGARLADRKLLLAAADRHLAGLLRDRARVMRADDDSAFALVATPQGRVALAWRGAPVARVQQKGARFDLSVSLEPGSEKLPGAERAALLAHLQSIVTRDLEKHLGPLMAVAVLARDSHASPPLRALCVALVEADGVIARSGVKDLLAQLDAPARQALKRLGIITGSLDIYCPAALRPMALQRLALLRQAGERGPSEPAPEAAPGQSPDQALFGDPPATDPVLALSSLNGARARAYRPAGSQAIRVDMAEKLIRDGHDQRAGQRPDAAKPSDPPNEASTDNAQSAGGAEQPVGQSKPRGFAIVPDLAVSMGLMPDNFFRLLHAAGFRRTERIAGDEGDMAVQLWHWRGLNRKGVGTGTDRRKGREKPKGPKRASKQERASADQPRVADRPRPRPGNAFAVLADMDFGGD